jgi:hypothetical protein
LGELRRVLTQRKINESESNLLIRRFLAMGESARGLNYNRTEPF